jgi:hypothetical protein
VRRKRWAGRAARIGNIRNVYNILIGESKGKRSLRRPKCKWEDNIRIDLREIGGKARTGFIWLRTGTSGRLL